MLYRYNLDKNNMLLKTRGIGFEELMVEVSRGNLLDVTSHPNNSKYPNQDIMYIRCLKQVYLVPYVIEDDGTFFLKTLYPSRKATKKYLNHK